MKRSLLIIITFVLTFPVLANDPFKDWFNGSVVLKNHDTIQCQLRLTRKVAEGLLQMTTDGVRSNILTVREVSAFWYYDVEKKCERVFLPVTIQTQLGGKALPVFTESLYANEAFAIVIHRTMGYSSKKIQLSPFRRKVVIDNYYLVNRETGNAEVISVANALKMLDLEKPAIVKQLKDDHIRLRSVEDYRSALTVSQKVF